MATDQLTLEDGKDQNNMVSRYQQTALSVKLHGSFYR